MGIGNEWRACYFGDFQICGIGILSHSGRILRYNNAPVRGALEGRFQSFASETNNTELRSHFSSGIMSFEFWPGLAAQPRNDLSLCIATIGCYHTRPFLLYPISLPAISPLHRVPSLFPHALVCLKDESPNRSSSNSPVTE